MSENWNDYADGWDTNKDVIYYSENVFKSLISVVKIKNSRILDFGCGTGLLTQRLSPFANEIVALDSSEKMIAILKDKNLPNVVTIVKPLTESLISENQLLSAKFDLIVASSVCGFLPDYEQTLSLLKSLLIPDGIFVQWDWLAEDSSAEFGLSEDQVTSAIQKTGFVLQSLGQSFSLTSSEGTMQVLMAVAKNA